ncbi:MAG: pentapeptide repeat-containing protein [Bacteroidia bacterium]
MILVFSLNPELRFHSKVIFERVAKWLYPSNDDRNADLLKILLSVVAGFGVLISIYVSLWRAKTTEESVRLQGEAINKQAEQIQLAAKSQIDERFSNAIEHLGSDKEPVLLGGIAELHQIAKENQTAYAEVVFNILCSYIRSNTSVIDKKAKDFNHTAIQTIIDYLFKVNPKAENPYKGLIADLNHSNLSGKNLNDCNLNSSNLSFCHLPDLENVELNSADISCAKFFLSKLHNVNLTNAKAHNTNFFISQLKDVSFENCKELLTVHFTDSELKNVNFDNTKIYGSSFISSHLSQVSFNNCEVMSTSFACSILSKTDFITTKAMFQLDFRASAFTDVTFKSFISRSKFNGCDRTFENYRFHIHNRLKSRTGQKADVSSINYNTTLFDNCQTEVLTQTDVDEITELHTKLISDNKMS